MPLDTDHLSDIQVFALTVWAEARGESLEGRLAVANVIINRAKAGFRGNTIRKVCLSPKQFSCWNMTDTQRVRMLDPKTLDDPKFSDIYVMCRSVLTQGGERRDPTNGADHYYADYIAQPVWAKKMERTAKIGRHIFYRQKPLSKSRTITGSQVAAGATVLVPAIEAVKPIVETVQQLEPIMPYVQTAMRVAPWALAIVALAGIGWIVWARIDDRRKGAR